MNEISFEEITKNISDVMKNTAYTPQEIGAGFKELGKILENFSQLSDKEKAQFWIDAFSNPDNKEACNTFARRHSDCSLNAFIPNEQTNLSILKDERNDL